MSPARIHNSWNKLSLTALAIIIFPSNMWPEVRAFANECTTYKTLCSSLENEAVCTFNLGLASQGVGLMWMVTLGLFRIWTIFAYKFKGRRSTEARNSIVSFHTFVLTKTEHWGLVCYVRKKDCLRVRIIPEGRGCRWGSCFNYFHKSQKKMFLNIWNHIPEAKPFVSHFHCILTSRGTLFFKCLGSLRSLRQQRSVWVPLPFLHPFQGWEPIEVKLQPKHIISFVTCGNSEQ